MALLKSLVAQRPDVPEYQHRLGMAHLFLAMIQGKGKQWPDAEASFKNALELERALVAANAKDMDYKHQLGRAYFGLGDVHRALNHHTEAFAAYRLAIEPLSKNLDAAPDNADLRRELFEAWAGLTRSLVVMGRASEAMDATRQCRTVARDEPNLLYKLACLLAWQLSQAPLERRADLGSEAMTTLRLAISAGFLDLPKMRSETDLDPLRERHDFQLLIMDMAFPADPFARGD
jgi:eukaryotic-like serine/threonine-protein kinase